MKQEFRITIDADANHAGEEFLNTMQKVAQKAEFEHGIDVTVQRLESTDTQIDGFTSAGDLDE